MANFGNILIIIFISYYSMYFLKILFNKKFRKSVQVTNQYMEKLRQKKVKTLEEQKKFLNLKYPKSQKSKWSFVGILKGILYIIFFITIFQFYNFVFLKIGLFIKLWVAIIFVMVFPIVANIILQKFNLQKSDLNIYLR